MSCRVFFAGWFKPRHAARLRRRADTAPNLRFSQRRQTRRIQGSATAFLTDHSTRVGPAAILPIPAPQRADTERFSGLFAAGVMARRW